MLNQSKLQKQLSDMFHHLLPKCFEQALLSTFNQDSEQGKNCAKEFKDTIDKLLCDPLAKELSLIIDTYIKNADIHGTVITFGSSSSQTATINSPSVSSNGNTPNTLKID